MTATTREMLALSHNPLSPDLSGQAQVRLPSCLVIVGIHPSKRVLLLSSIACGLNRGERDGESAACLTFEDHHQKDILLIPLPKCQHELQHREHHSRANIAPLIPNAPISAVRSCNSGGGSICQLLSCSSVGVRWQPAPEDALPTTPSQTTSPIRGGLFCFVC